MCSETFLRYSNICSQIISPWLGDTLYSGIVLSYRPVGEPVWQPMPESTISPRSGTTNLASICRWWDWQSYELYVAEEETVGQRARWAVTLQHHKLGPVISAIVHSSIQYTQYTQIHCTSARKFIWARIFKRLGSPGIVPRNEFREPVGSCTYIIIYFVKGRLCLYLFIYVHTIQR